MRFCNKCKKEKNLSEFHKNGGSSKTEYRAVCKECKRGEHYQRTYGIGIEEYNIILVKQGGTCKICDGEPGARSLHIDHCHDTGKIRGLLCANCNTGIGNLKDDINLLEKAINYLKN